PVDSSVIQYEGTRVRPVVVRRLARDLTEVVYAPAERLSSAQGWAQVGADAVSPGKSVPSRGASPVEAACDFVEVIDRIAIGPLGRRRLNRYVLLAGPEE